MHSAHFGYHLETENFPQELFWGHELHHNKLTIIHFGGILSLLCANIESGIKI